MGRDAGAPIVDLCVIGGGWAGLAAAVEACERGRSVVLLEAAPQLGGRARTLETDMGFGPVRLDNGQHLMMGAYRETLRLIDRVATGGTECIRRYPLSLTDTDGLSLRALRLPAPAHLGLALLLATGLNPRERIACVRLLIALRIRRWKVPAGETVARLLERARQPDSLIRKLWQPLCVSALNTPIATACARTFAAVLRDTLGANRRASDFVLAAETLGDCLPAPAARWLEAHGATIRLRHPVRALHEVAGIWSVQSGDQTITSRAVVLALPPANSERLLSTSATVRRSARWPGIRDSLKALRPTPIATVYLAWPEEQIGSIPKWTMLAQQPLTDTPAGTTKQAIWLHSDSRSKIAFPPCSGDWVFDRGTQQGHRIVSVVVSAPPPGALESSESLRESVARTVADRMRVPLPSHSFIIVERRATFACVPDRPQLAQTVDATQCGLWLAGDFTEPDYPATLESAVRSGLKAGAQASDWLIAHPSIADAG